MDCELCGKKNLILLRALVEEVGAEEYNEVRACLECVKEYNEGPKDK